MINPLSVEMTRRELLNGICWGVGKKFTKPFERFSPPEEDDWSEEEIAKMKEAIGKDLDYLPKVFGPGNKPIETIALVRTSDSLAATWGWAPNSTPSLSYDPATQECTFYISNQIKEPAGTFDDTRFNLTYLTFRALIGGLDPTGAFSRNAQPYPFRQIVNYEGPLPPECLASPDFIFGEETLGNLAAVLTEKNLWNVDTATIPLAKDPPEYNGYARNGIFDNLLQSDPNFYLKIRSAIEQTKILNNDRTPFSTVSEIVKSTSPQGAAILGW